MNEPITITGSVEKIEAHTRYKDGKQQLVGYRVHLDYDQGWASYIVPLGHTAPLIGDTITLTVTAAPSDEEE